MNISGRKAPAFLEEGAEDLSIHLPSVRLQYLSQRLCLQREMPAQRGISPGDQQEPPAAGLAAASRFSASSRCSAWDCAAVRAREFVRINSILGFFLSSSCKSDCSPVGHHRYTGYRLCPPSGRHPVPQRYGQTGRARGSRPPPTLLHHIRILLPAPAQWSFP